MHACEYSEVQLSHMAMGVLVSVAWVHANLSTEFGPECNKEGQKENRQRWTLTPTGD